MKTLADSITAQAKSIRSTLYNRRFQADFFQREYDWKERHVAQLIEDLQEKFDDEFAEFPHNGEILDELKDVRKYGEYFLGPIISAVTDDGYSIIDGQQRLTTITLLLICLDRLQVKSIKRVPITDLVYSETYGEKDFTIKVDDRMECMNALLKGQEYDGPVNKSVENILKRFEDIDSIIQSWLEDHEQKTVLPLFITWLIQRVIFVEIKTVSTVEAYKIFQTMNDRGLGLTSTDLLKGFLLQKIENEQDRKKLNEFWKKRIYELTQLDDGRWNDALFFHHWLRAKYAETIRAAKVDAEDQDFELIAKKYHEWIRKNAKKLRLESPEQVSNFIKVDLDFFQKQFLKIYNATKIFNPDFAHVYYISNSNMFSAYSLFYPLLMAPLKRDDSDKTIQDKIQLVSMFLEMYSVNRKSNNRSLSHSTIRYSMYNLIKEIRDCSTTVLREKLKKSLQTLPKEKHFFEHEGGYWLRKQNKGFVKFLLARLTSYVDAKTGGEQDQFQVYMKKRPKKDRFQIEHILADKFFEHRSEFNDKPEFDKFRNSLGALILLQIGTNQSLSDMPYSKKVKHYQKQNILAKSLTPIQYLNEPKFMKFKKESGLPFRSYEKFTKVEIEERMELYKKICEEIWSLKNF